MAELNPEDAWRELAGALDEAWLQLKAAARGRTSRAPSGRPCC